MRYSNIKLILYINVLLIIGIINVFAEKKIKTVEITQTVGVYGGCDLLIKDDGEILYKRYITDKNKGLVTIKHRLSDPLKVVYDLAIKELNKTKIISENLKTEDWNYSLIIIFDDGTQLENPIKNKIDLEILTLKLRSKIILLTDNFVPEIEVPQ